MKAKEIRAKSQRELIEAEKELKAELFKLRFQLATNQLDNPMRLKEVKRSIARIKTVMREREIRGIDQ